ncbi:MAG TPA: TIGR04086 family membrane protein [Caproicibacter sp.]|nr:TIGR04086 family membrane protein [Caproicibacter sp.]
MKGSNAVGQKPILSAVRAIIIGAVAGAALCAVLLAISALAFVSSENIPQNFLPAFIIAVSVISALFAGFIAAKISKQRGLIYGSMAAMLLFILFLVSGLATSQSTVSSESFIRLLVMLLSGAIGGLIGVSRKSKRK